MNKDELLSMLDGFIEDEEQTDIRDMSEEEYAKEWEKINTNFINREQLISDVAGQIARQIDVLSERYDNITLFLSLYKVIKQSIICGDELGIPLVQTGSVDSGYERLYNTLIVADTIKSLRGKPSVVDIN